MHIKVDVKKTDIELVKDIFYMDLSNTTHILGTDVGNNNDIDSKSSFNTNDIWIIYNVESVYWKL
jgi:hypothetical protein